MLLEELTSTQISEWQAYDSLEPLGELLDDFRIARLSQLIFNLTQSVHGKKGSFKHMDIEDFMPDYALDIDPDDDASEPEYQTVDQMKQFMMSMVSRTKKSKKDKRNG